MCTHSNTISASGNNGGSGIGDSDGGEVEITYGVLYGNDRVCDRVHSQYCRRHEKKGRSVECAGTCVEETSCVSTDSVCIIKTAHIHSAILIVISY